MNRHHQSPSFIEGYSQDVTEVSGGHEGIKKSSSHGEPIVLWNLKQPWWRLWIQTISLQNPMIFPWYSYGDSPIFHGNSHELSTDLPYSYGIPMIFLWYSYDIPMNSPQIFETPPDPWPSCPAPARLCARCSPRRSPGTRTDRCHRAPVHAEKPEGLSLGWEEPDKPWVFMNVLPKMVGKP